MRDRRTRQTSLGASLVEYALLAALVAVICIVAMRALGNKVSVHFSAHASQLSIALSVLSNWAIEELFFTAEFGSFATMV